MHGAVIAGRNVKITIRVESQAGRVHEPADERLGLAGRRDAKDRHRRLLSARPRKGDEDIALRVYGRISDRVQILLNQPRDLELDCVARPPILTDLELSRL